MRSFWEKAYKPSEAKDKHTQYDKKPTGTDTHQKCTSVCCWKNIYCNSVSKSFTKISHRLVQTIKMSVHHARKVCK